jgi:hypothetical protein
LHLSFLLLNKISRLVNYVLRKNEGPGTDPPFSGIEAWQSQMPAALLPVRGNPLAALPIDFFDFVACRQ